VAHRHYRRAGEWRHVADENRIEDPRRLFAGSVLAVPPIRGGVRGARP
jgi:hypothetical protein